MITLAINTSGLESAVALLDGPRILATQAWQERNREAEKLMPAIAALYRENDLDFDSTKRVFAVRGPGSFTGLRVGITTANCFSYLTRSKLYSFDVFEYHWQRYLLEFGDDSGLLSDTALLIFAGSGGLFISENLQDHNSAAEISLENAISILKERGIKRIFGDLSEEQRLVLQDFDYFEPQANFAETIASLDLDPYLVQPEPFQIIHPVYLKGPGITPSKKTIFDDK